MIEHINLKKFKTFHEDEIVEVKTGVPEAKDEDHVTEIDLTEEAIINDKVTVNYAGDNDTSSATTIAAVATEEVIEATTLSALADMGEKKLLITTTLASLNSEEESDGYELTVEESDEINEIDTGDDKFFVSKQTAEAAKKYGYKILLKKVGSEEIPVGKIKFSLPTVVEIQSIDDSLTGEENIQDTTTTTTVKLDNELVNEDELEDEVSTTKVQEPVTEPPVVYLPPPITAVVPTVESIDEESILEGVMKIKEETDSAIDEIMKSEEEVYLKYNPTFF